MSENKKSPVTQTEADIWECPRAIYGPLTVLKISLDDDNHRKYEAVKLCRNLKNINMSG